MLIFTLKISAALSTSTSWAAAVTPDSLLANTESVPAIDISVVWLAKRERQILYFFYKKYGLKVYFIYNINRLDTLKTFIICENSNQQNIWIIIMI